MPFPTPRQAMMLTIARWEGLFQAMPGDPGNYIEGRLVGTMRGVTPAVLAQHRGIPGGSITVETMKSVTLEEAADIAVLRFYRGWIDPLAWNACADVVTDFGWGAGPGQAVKSTERDFLKLDGADFRFDARSVAAWQARHDAGDIKAMVMDFFGVRSRFYDLICRLNPDLQQFRQGWHNRAVWQTPACREWWAHWEGESTAALVSVAEPMPPVALPPRVLSRGMFGAEVKALQLALIRAGYGLPSGADGSFGGETDAAVRRFQTDHGLTVDGWVGEKTRAALKARGQLTEAA